jgi:hypothetical protein
MDYKQINDKQIFDVLSKFGDPYKIKVLYVSTYYFPNYVRAESILDILQRNKIKVISILEENKKLRYFLALFASIIKLRECDVILLPFRSHELLPIFRFITKKPIVFDAFISLYDTLCFDRKIFKPDSIVGKILKWYDTYLCRIANLVLLDTKTHCEYFTKEFDAKNVSYLYLECNKELFKPIAVEEVQNKFVVFWYGKCWPSQGVQVILKAARILKDESEIIFRLVGPVRKRYRNLVENLNSQNIEFIDYIPYERLPLEIAKANLCLGGHFSNLPKAERVIAGKTFQFIACGKRTILGDNSANRELFNEAKDICFVEMNSGEELAKIILKEKNRLTKNHY